MKFRTFAVTLLTLLAWTGLASSQKTRGIYTPHKPGVSAIPVTASHADVPVEAPASGATWTKAVTAPPASVGAMLLLTDGRVLVHSEPNCNGCTGNYSNWYTLTPDNTGSYVNGTWTQVASLPSGYEPLFFGSAVLADGKVVVQGGEYNCPNSRCSGVWQSLGAIYDPVANTWMSTVPPTKSRIGDAESVVLPDGTWMLAQCCAVTFGESSFPVYYSFDESTLSFTELANSTDGKNDEFDEEGWTLLPNNLILTVDAYTSNTVLTGTNSETYNSVTNMWTTAGSTINQLWDSGCEKGGANSFELGPAVLRPDGTVIYSGASDCEAGHTAVYNSSTGVWTAGPDFPNKGAANDAPAALEINGNVIIETNPYSGTFSTPSTFYEWDGTNLNTFPNPPNATKTASYQGHLLVLPNGQVMYTDYSTDVEFLTSAGTYSTSWQPAVTSVPTSLSPGVTYTVSGTQFNGLSAGSAYGDDLQNATNYPLVRIVNNATGHVFYCKTHGHSTMGVATGNTVVSTSFDVPAGIETGASELFVVANGIASAASAVTVGASGTFTLATTPKSITVTHGTSGSVRVITTVSGGFDSAVALTASGQGSGVSVKFVPSTIPAPGSGHASMNIHVASTAKTGTRTITVTGTGGGVTKTATVTLTIN